jgi:hypothetical protein
MWFRNSGGFVAANNSSSSHESSEVPSQSNVQVEHAAMFTEREQEEDVRMSSSDMHSVKISPYEDTDQVHDRMGVMNTARLESHDDPTMSYGQHMEPMDFQNPATNVHDPDPHNMNFALPQFVEDQVTSLFFDPSTNIPDPALDFEWLFDNLSADMNSAGGSAGIPSVTSPHSSISATEISPPGLVPSPAHIRHPLSPQSSQSSPWAEVRANLLKALSTLDPEIAMSSFFYPSNLAVFWDLYFENYHPHFPILHKQTLDPVKASPLMVAAIVTLGSTLSGDAVHWDASIKIHDTLRYLIFGVRFFLLPTLKGRKLT